MPQRMADFLRRALFQRSMRPRSCAHLDMVAALPPPEQQCQACAAENTRTVHLRRCLTCGVVGCCDSSPAKHARAHHEQTGHPLIRSIEPAERWAWCYEDEAYIPDVPGPT